MTARITDEQREDRSWTENALKAAVLKIAAERGWMVYTLTQNVVKRPQRKSSGYPDLTLARHGKVIWMELKMQTGQLSPEQEKWREAIGADYYIVRPDVLRLGVVEVVLR